MDEFNDDFLRKLIQKVELDSPSSNFTDIVMNRCYATEILPSKLDWIKKALPWAAIFVIFVTLTSLLLYFGVPLLPTLLSGTSLVNILSTIKLTSVGIVIGFLGMCTLIYKYKLKLKSELKYQIS